MFGKSSSCLTCFVVSWLVSFDSASVAVPLDSGVAVGLLFWLREFSLRAQEAEELTKE